MLAILLKSSACLVIFMLFYKLCLEKTSMHTFKRYYLIGVLLISIGIPFITFTEYILIESTNPLTTLTLEPQNYSNKEFIKTAKPKNYLPIILWSIYILGVVIFSIRFLKNLYQLVAKIKQNPKFKNESIYHVLLQDLTPPHTFFNYIFLNKTKYANHQIPKEVLFHEQTHAKQKHSLDIIFIETFQILFWFNPLLYFIKKDIKLNHEFLADQAVINKGVNTKHYQQLLLAFSSPDSYRGASHSSFANAFNYSLIKKRFTVMRTQTSKQTFWFRSLVLLPLLAFLIYGFSQKIVIEKEVDSFVTTQESNPSNDIKIFINKERKVFIDTKLIDFENLSNELIRITKNNIIKPTLYIEIGGHLSTQYLEDIKNEVEKSKLKISMLKADSISFNENEYKKGTKEYFKGIPYTADTYLQIKTKKKELTKGVSKQQKATKEQITEYNKLAKYCKLQIDKKLFVKQKDAIKLKSLYDLMTPEQKEKVESFPDFSLLPPPPAPESPKAPNTKP